MCFTGSWDATVRTWDVVVGACLTVSDCHLADVYAIATHPDRPFLAVTCSRDTTMRFWSTEALAPAAKLRAVMGADPSPAKGAGVKRRSDGPKTLAGRRVGGELSDALKRRAEDDGSPGGGGGELRDCARLRRVFEAPGHPAAGEMWRLASIEAEGPERYRRRLSSNDRGTSAGYVPHRFEATAAAAREAEALEASVASARAGSAQKEAVLRKAAECRLRRGDVRGYCERMREVGDWNAALAAAPAVSLAYWSSLAGRARRRRRRRRTPTRTTRRRCGSSRGGRRRRRRRFSGGEGDDAFVVACAHDAGAFLEKMEEPDDASLGASRPPAAVSSASDDDDDDDGRRGAAGTPSGARGASRPAGTTRTVPPRTVPRRPRAVPRRSGRRRSGRPSRPSRRPPGGRSTPLPRRRGELLGLVQERREHARARPLEGEHARGASGPRRRAPAGLDEPGLERGEEEARAARAASPARGEGPAQAPQRRRASRGEGGEARRPLGGEDLRPDRGGGPPGGPRANERVGGGARGVLLLAAHRGRRRFVLLGRRGGSRSVVAGDDEARARRRRRRAAALCLSAGDARGAATCLVRGAQPEMAAALMLALETKLSERPSGDEGEALTTTSAPGGDCARALLAERAAELGEWDLSPRRVGDFARRRAEVAGRPRPRRADRVGGRGLSVRRFVPRRVRRGHEGVRGGGSGGGRRGERSGARARGRRGVRRARRGGRGARRRRI